MGRKIDWRQIPDIEPLDAEGKLMEVAIYPDGTLHIRPSPARRGRRMIDFGRFSTRVDAFCHSR